MVKNSVQLRGTVKRPTDDTSCGCLNHFFFLLFACTVSRYQSGSRLAPLENHNSRVVDCWHLQERSSRKLASEASITSTQVLFCSE